MVKLGSPEDHKRDQVDLEVLRLLDAGMSQSEIARRTGVSQPHISVLKKAAE